ncbi:MAG TPA: DUF4199 domain-containing protein [Hanamia sp.]
MEQPVQPVTTPLTKGIAISLVLIVYGLITYFLDLGDSATKTTQWLGYLVFIIGIIWSVNMYGKQINYNSTFGNYFSHGFKISAFVTLIMILFMVIFVYLFPDIKEKAIESARKGMIDQKLTEEQINNGIQITQKFFMVGIIAWTLISYLFFGALASLIGAGITKKNPVQFTDGR